MATQYDPIAKDESLNTTEATPRNIADVLAEGLKGIEDALPPSYTEGDGIDISNNEISVDTTFTEASTRANIASGESFSTILGKIKKFFTDLKTVAFTGAYSDLSGTENVAYKNESNQFSANQTIDKKNGTSTTVGHTYLNIGNSTPSGTAGNSKGHVLLYEEGANYVDLYTDTLTANRDIKIPDKSGILALTDDLNSCIKYTYIGDGVGAGAGEHAPYFDFAANNCEGGFYICVLINQNLDNPKRESITLVTVRSTGQVRSFIPDSDSNWSKDGTKIVGRMASHYSNIKVYKIDSVL